MSRKSRTAALASQAPTEPRLPTIPRAASGVSGFDALSGGGLPRGRTTLLLGGPGSGKTIFSLQALAHGAAHGEPGIFVSFEERAETVRANLAAFPWMRGSERHLVVLDGIEARLAEHNGEFDLLGLLAMVGARVAALGAARIAFDGIDVLTGLLGDAAAERRELFRLYDWLGQQRLTGLITAKQGSELDRGLGRGFLEFMADCVVELDNRLVRGLANRTVRVVKLRGGHHSAMEAPMVIGGHGIEIEAPEGREMAHQVFAERVSSGVDRLDTMLGGGYFRGSTVLVSGVPGTAKTTLGGAFIAAACDRQERSLYVSFDESGGQIVRNLRSVGIDLRRAVSSGMLRLFSTQAATAGPFEHLLRLRQLIDSQEPRCLVVDQLSSLIQGGGGDLASAAAARLIDLCKQRGITLLMTALLDKAEGLSEATALAISALADTWIHLSYAIRSGERNRALTIIKSRGSSHSNQVRELLLSHSGLTLADVHTAGGEVLMGTLRWEKEREENRLRQRADDEVERRRRMLALELAEAQARLAAVSCEIEAKSADLQVVKRNASAESTTRLADAARMRQLRQADAGSPARRRRPVPPVPSPPEGAVRPGERPGRR